MPSESDLHEYVQVWKHTGFSTLVLKDSTVLPEKAVVVNQPSKELGPEGETTLTWKAVHGDTLGTVVWATPREGIPGNGMLFGVRLGRGNIPGGTPARGSAPFFEYMVQHVGAPQHAWIRPKDSMQQKVTFTVDTGDFSILVTITPPEVGIPESTTLGVEVMDLDFPGSAEAK